MDYVAYQSTESKQCRLSPPPGVRSIHTGVRRESQFRLQGVLQNEVTFTSMTIPDESGVNGMYLDV